jgi:hypothetical protein
LFCSLCSWSPSAFLRDISIRWPSLGPDGCSLLTSDHPHIINSGWLMVRNDRRGRHILRQWMDQWDRFRDTSWVDDQGYLQNTVLELLSRARPNAYPVYKGQCQKEENGHRRNLCYKDTLESWGYPYLNRMGMEGLCLLPPDNDARGNFRVNLHGGELEHEVDTVFIHAYGDSKVNSKDYKLPGGALHNADSRCPWPDASQEGMDDDKDFICTPV